MIYSFSPSPPPLPPLSPLLCASAELRLYLTSRREAPGSAGEHRGAPGSAGSAGKRRGAFRLNLGSTSAEPRLYLGRGAAPGSDSGRHSGAPGSGNGGTKFDYLHENIQVQTPEFDYLHENIHFSLKTGFDGFYLRIINFNHIVASASPKNRQER